MGANYVSVETEGAPQSPQPLPEPKSQKPWITLGLIGLAALFIVIFWVAGAFDPVLGWAYKAQQGFSRDFTTLIRNMRAEAEAGSLYGSAAGLAMVGSLIGLGFLYGVFHAVGPGHGKAVITAYALTQDIPPKRTALLAMGAALVQGGSAVVLVLILSIVVEGSLRRITKDADRLLEMISYGAVGFVGLYLFVAGGRALRATYRKQKGDPHHGHHDHGACGHNHGPTPDQVKDADTWWKAALVAIAVGLRPCSGAILVLVLTFAFGLWAAGVATVFFMTLGTGITVAFMALTALGLRLPLVSALSSIGLRTGPVLGALGCLGGGLIAAMGASLLWDALNRPVHPFL